jgi:uncharacterized protein (TIGR00251 family)
MNLIHPHPKGLVIKVFVQPRSSKNLIVGPHGDALKIKLTAPPVAGEANRLCIKFLAKSLGLPKTALEILSGHSSRTKHVLVHIDSDKSKKQMRIDIQKWIGTTTYLKNAD